MFRFWFVSVIILWMQKAQIGHCEKPCIAPDVSNGYLIKFTGIFTYEEIPEGKEIENKTTLHLRCNKGFRPNGEYKEVPFSCIDGKLSLDPKCLPKPCTVPAISNGYIFKITGRGPPSARKAMQHMYVPEGTYIEDGIRLYLRCYINFSPNSYVQEVHVSCSDGKWTLEPKCSPEVKCNVPESPRHGSVDLPDGILKVDDIAYYKCDEGRKLVGASRTKCLASGDWTFPPPACLEQCTVPAIPNGYLIKKTGRRSRPVEKVYEGTYIEDKNILYLRCYKNFSPNEQPVHVSCSDGKWAVEPKCFPDRCYINSSNVPGIVQLQHGEYEDGMVLVPQCKEGFRLSDEGEIKMICSKGEWTGSVFPCIGGWSCVIFPSLSVLRTLVSRTNYVVCIRNRVNDCSGGFITAGEEEESFTEIDLCPLLEETEGLSIIYTGGREPKSRALFGCAKRYKINGPTTVTCSEDGKWSEPSPYCTKVLLCPLLVQTEGLAITYTDERKTKSNAVFQCAQPYKRNGPAIVTCLEDGKWSGPSPYCTSVYGCYISKQSKESTLTFHPIKDAYKFGDSVVFMCDIGQELTPKVERVTCLQNGWSQNIPYCRNKM